MLAWFPRHQRPSRERPAHNRACQECGASPARKPQRESRQHRHPEPSRRSAQPPPASPPLSRPPALAPPPVTRHPSRPAANLDTAPHTTLPTPRTRQSQTPTSQIVRVRLPPGQPSPRPRQADGDHRRLLPRPESGVGFGRSQAMDASMRPRGGCEPGLRARLQPPSGYRSWWLALARMALCLQRSRSAEASMHALWASRWASGTITCPAGCSCARGRSGTLTRTIGTA